jgi:serine/threonine-protein phosphatase 2A regulatory subunit B
MHAEDLISAVQFDGTGDYLATGDRGGRVVIFESSEVAHRQMQRESSSDMYSGAPRDIEYRFYCEFQSHEPEFDYLKSLEIEEKINRIRWRHGRAGPLFLLSTNDKTIKLWKIYEKKVRMVSSRNVEVRNGTNPFIQQLRMPTLHPVQSIATASLKRTFSNGHTYHINSLSFSPDGETYLSADDLRINLWSLHNTSSTFNIVDIKPDDMEELAEVITSAEFHPIHASQLVYSSSKGLVRLCDLRESARVHKHSGRTFGHAQQSESERTFFSEVIASMSDVKFSRDGRYVMARDYMTLKIWDVNMASSPLRTIKVHEHLRSKLCELYESDCIFDKFECSWGHDDRHVCSGTYDNKLLLWDTFGDGQCTTLESVSAAASPARRTSTLKGKLGLARKDSMNGRNFAKKILHHSHHPQRNLVAIGARNSLYIFAAP